LEVEEPVSCRDFSSFDFHAALTGVLGTTLIGHQVIQERETVEKRLLTSPWVMKPFHGEQFPLDGIMG